MPILIYFDSEKSAIYHAMTMTDDSVRSFCSLLSEKNNKPQKSERIEDTQFGRTFYFENLHAPDALQ